MIRPFSTQLGQTMRKTTIHSHVPIIGYHEPTAEPCERDRIEQQWDASIERLNDVLEELARACVRPGADLDSLFQQLTQQLHQAESYCRSLEQVLGDDLETIRQKQAEFRKRTDHFFACSYLMNRARTWPRGYPGDYEIIENTYENRPLSAGIGLLLDRYFLASTLAQGIQRRREKMREALTDELSAPPSRAGTQYRLRALPRSGRTGRCDPTVRCSFHQRRFRHRRPALLRTANARCQIGTARRVPAIQRHSDDQRAEEHSRVRPV